MIPIHMLSAWCWEGKGKKGGHAERGGAVEFGGYKEVLWWISCSYELGRCQTCPTWACKEWISCSTRYHNLGLGHTAHRVRALEGFIFILLFDFGELITTNPSVFEIGTYSDPNNWCIVISGPTWGCQVCPLNTAQMLSHADNFMQPFRAYLCMPDVRKWLQDTGV